ncbi:tRNA (adenine(22)-N(1))-methyltransferase [Clostridium coskatii]|uniref:tRNA (Adenine(22)-N(1))-methyltransferase n=1 Tax=Clostridium coskatii TaxID=1705578 RepID=A0A162NEE4_9CLOT|nr:class I SAM-dependent methyltransferase [Clostridium coskatii]OAA92469.1 tRNA (adenine(22)-N(1))-methyltransferase [Clostridium coskatii]OBR89952.1 tRNA (adenine(22)-N(1))-methyltransferase [Clostridium coskatii]
MEISLRLKIVSSMVDNCECVADIGTDHGYVPIYLVESKVCKRAIASDINKGPVEKARFNIKLHGLENKIDVRLGSGLATIKPGEAQYVIIAGMGGNLIRDIIIDGMEVFKKADALILQPMRNSEVLREYIYKSGFKIIDEELCIDENRFYEIIKIRYDNERQEVDNIFYEVGKALIDKKHKLLLKFVRSKIESYNKIILNIKDNTELARSRREDLCNKIKKLQELIECI